MGNLHLVTGRKGEAHITPADHGSLNAAIFGEGSYVLDRGNKFAANNTTGNNVQIADGDILMQGRHIRLDEGTVVNLTIESGTQGMLRRDLIVCRYTKDSVTGVEDSDLAVIKGTPVASNPVDPAYTSGDIINDHVLLAEMPLYRVSLNGTAIEEITALFTEANVIPDGAVTTDKIGSKAVTAAKLGDGAVTTAKLGSKSVTEAKIASGAVTSDKIADSAVGTAKIADSAVTSAKLGSSAVTTAKIANSAVTEAKIASGAVTEAKIASGAVTFTFTATLEVAKWTQKTGFAEYRLSVEGLVADPRHIEVDICSLGITSVTTLKNINKEWSKIIKCSVLSAGVLYFVFPKTPSIDIPIKGTVINV